MSEDVKQIELKDNSWADRTLATIFVCSLVFSIMQIMGLLRGPLGLLWVTLIYSSAFLVGYWIPPRPPLSYSRFAFRVLFYVILWLAGLWAIPKLLSKWIWIPLAYALPTLILFISFYWIPQIYPGKRQERLWAWLLMSIALAVLYGWAAGSEDK